MRIFTAVVPPEEAVEHLDEFLSVRRGAADFRWASADQLHLTLAFAAQVEVWRLDDLIEASARRRPGVRRAVRGWPAAGAFPDLATAKVLWAGLDAEDASLDGLAHLARGCRSALARAGGRADGQRFVPHLTVARLTRPQHVGRWVRLLDAYEGPSWVVGSVRVLASHLGEGPRRRPRYEVLAELPLGG